MCMYGSKMFAMLANFESGRRAWQIIDGCKWGSTNNWFPKPSLLFLPDLLARATIGARRGKSLSNYLISRTFVVLISSTLRAWLEGSEAEAGLGYCGSSDVGCQTWRFPPEWGTW